MNHIVYLDEINNKIIYVLTNHYGIEDFQILGGVCSELDLGYDLACDEYIHRTESPINDSALNSVFSDWLELRKKVPF